MTACLRQPCTGTACRIMSMTYVTGNSSVNGAPKITLALGMCTHMLCRLHQHKPNISMVTKDGACIQAMQMTKLSMFLP